VLSIGRFQVSPEFREIRLDGRNVQIGGRAYDILEMLILAGGALVTKEQILDSVWPRSIVGENNVHVHMTAVRKTLGKDRDLIRTVSGRGYHLRMSGAATSGYVKYSTDSHPSIVGPCNHNLPVHASSLIGRTHAIEKVNELLASSQLVTLIGAGGIGKTRLAIEVGRGLRARFPDGVFFVPLGGVMDAGLVIHALTAVLAIKTTEELISFRRVAERINGKKILVLLDNCEHVLKSVPEIAERLMRTNSDIRILATSREPLSVTDECIYCVPPLDIPRTGDFSEDDMHASAVDLFLTRARAANPCYPMDPKTLQLTMAVCRHLDGIPLAIELAAARAAVFRSLPQTWVIHLACLPMGAEQHRHASGHSGRRSTGATGHLTKTSASFCVESVSSRCHSPFTQPVTLLGRIASIKSSSWTRSVASYRSRW
jgi:DNA-binding winged helix-turn-helix (wHTH) protein